MKRGFLILVSLVCFATLLPMLSGMFPKEKDGITVYQAETDKTIRMPLEEFLVGVVAAEMPALFETESLKAQAVAARTYAVSRLQNGEELCTDPTHCQAYADRNTLKERWGAQFDTYYRRIADAVKATEGEIAVYEGEPIVAVFHAASSGRTENSEDVWSTDTPYLRSVESAIPAELNEMEQETVFDRPDFIHTLNTLRPTAATTPLVGQVTKTESGRVAEIVLGSATYSGAEIRTLFSLNSTDFTMQESGNQVIIITRGKGHGVGMSQYGCNELAKAGKNYREILAHYYQGTQVHKLENF